MPAMKSNSPQCSAARGCHEMADGAALTQALSERKWLKTLAAQTQKPHGTFSSAARASVPVSTATDPQRQAPQHKPPTGNATAQVVDRRGRAPAMQGMEPGGARDEIFVSDVFWVNTEDYSTLMQQDENA